MNIQDRKKTLTVEELRRRYNLDALDKDRKAIKLQKDQLTKVDAELNDFVEITTKNLKELQDQVDGNITTWFFNGVPTVENEPSSNWTTEEEKINHLGDLYYDQDTGYAYRWAYENNTYVWSKIVDADVVEALAVANSAQDTADSKRRVFVNQPKPPYDIGDIWIKEDTDLYRCRASRSEGNFNTADWIRATNYTDDTVALGTKAELDQFKTQVTENYVTNATLETTTNSITGRVEETYTYVTTVENEVNGLTETVDETINNVAQLEIKVDGITTEVSHKYDFLQTDEGTNQLDFDNSLEHKPVSFNIQGYTEKFLYLFPAEAKLKELHIEGKSEQETRSGYNKAKTPYKSGTSKTQNGITFTVNKDGSIKMSGTSTGTAYFDIYEDGSNMLINELFTCSTGSNNANIEMQYYEYINSWQFKKATINGLLTTTPSTSATGQIFRIIITSGKTVDETLFPMILKGTYSSNTMPPFEQYGASPSPDYPSEIKTIPSIRNLLNNQDYTIGNIDGTNGSDITSTTTYRFNTYHECKGNTNIYLLKELFICYYDENKNFVSYDGNGGLTKTTPVNAKYVRFRTFAKDFDTFNNNDYMVSYTPVKSYVPYGAWAKVKITDDIFNNSFENKTISGDGSIANSTNRIKTVDFIEVNSNTTYTLEANTDDNKKLQVYVFEYKEDGTFIQRIGSSWNTLPYSFTTSIDTKNIHLLLSYTDATAIGITDITKGLLYTKEKEVLIDLSKPNLFDKDNIETGVSISYATGTTYSSSTSFATGYIDITDISILSWYGASNTENQTWGALYDENKNYLQGINVYNNRLTMNNSNAKYLRLGILSTYLNTFKIYEGYTDYYELSSIGDTKDELNIVNGQVVIDKKIGKVVLDGNENWIMVNSTTYPNMFQLPTTYDFSNCDGMYESGSGKAKSNYFVNDWVNTVRTTNGFTLFNQNGTGYIRIVNTNITSVDDFKEWLSNNNVVIEYPLEEPQQITLPNVQIPLFDGINHITLVDDLETRITVVYNNNSNVETSLSGTNTVTITDCIERNLYPSDDLYPLGIIEGSCE